MTLLLPANLCVLLLQWDILATKIKLFAQTKYIDLTTSNFESLADFEKVYKGKLLTLPYVSISAHSDGHLIVHQCTTVTAHLNYRGPITGGVTLSLAIRGWPAAIPP